MGGIHGRGLSAATAHCRSDCESVPSRRARPAHPVRFPDHSWLLDQALAPDSALFLNRHSPVYVATAIEFLLTPRFHLGRNMPPHGQYVSSRLFSLSFVPAMARITVSVVIVEVPVSTVIRMVIVFDSATASLPVPRIISVAVVVWCNPTSSLVGWSSPIALVPFVMSSHRIPITLDPHASGIGHCGDNRSYPGRRWRPNHDSNRNLRFACPSCD